MASAPDLLAAATDRELIAEVLSGVPAAIDAFVRRFSRLVYWTALRDGRLSRADADDVTQKVFIRLLDDGGRRLREWRGVSFEPWLRQIARNEAISFARGNIRSGHDPIDEDEPDLPWSGFDGEAEAQLAQMRAFIVDCFDGLAPVEQRAVVFRYRDELDQRTIAAMLGITQANAAQRVSRATRRLRDCLSAKLGPQPWLLS